MTAGGKERRLTELMKAFKLYPEIQFELVVMDTDIHYKEVLELSKNIHFLIRKLNMILQYLENFSKYVRISNLILLTVGIA